MLNELNSARTFQSIEPRHSHSKFFVRWRSSFDVGSFEEEAFLIVASRVVSESENIHVCQFRFGCCFTELFV